MKRRGWTPGMGGRNSLQAIKCLRSWVLECDCFCRPSFTMCPLVLRYLTVKQSAPTLHFGCKPGMATILPVSTEKATASKNSM